MSEINLIFIADFHKCSSEEKQQWNKYIKELTLLIWFNEYVCHHAFVFKFYEETTS